MTELWLNSTGDVYAELEAAGKVLHLADVFDPCGVEGWRIFAYLAESNPELTTIANPELVGGRFNNCPDGWGCRNVNDNIINALGMRDTMEIFDHGSGETLGTSIAVAYEDESPWFGYYWAPTANSPIMLMYEAFSALDSLIRTGMQDLQKELHKTIVFITHDLDEALKLADHLVIPKDGYIMQQGEPQHILLYPADS